jgi:hypothetical protein
VAPASGALLGVIFRLTVRSFGSGTPTTTEPFSEPYWIWTMEKLAVVICPQTAIALPFAVQ